MTKEEIVYTGSFFEIINKAQPDGRVFESVRRAPGVRVIIYDDKLQKLLLNREFRNELNDWDYRLPGGKVFDTLADYVSFRETGGDERTVADQKAIAESHEEAAIDVNSLEFVARSTLGATMEWDLLVYATSDWTKAEGQQLEAGERIETGNWFSFAEVEKMIMSGQMQEERIALILLRWLRKEGKL